METKGKWEKIADSTDFCISAICECVGGKMVGEACKALIPGCGIFTKLGAWLIGSGIGDIASAPARERIKESLKAIDELGNLDSKKEPEEQTSEEIVEAE